MASLVKSVSRSGRAMTIALTSFKGLQSQSETEVSRPPLLDLVPSVSSFLGEDCYKDCVVDEIRNPNCTLVLFLREFKHV